MDRPPRVSGPVLADPYELFARAGPGPLVKHV